MVIDLVEHGLNNKLGIVGFVDLSGQFVDGVLGVCFSVKFVLGFKRSFRSRGSELLKELIRHVVGIFNLLVGEPS